MEDSLEEIVSLQGSCSDMSENEKLEAMEDIKELQKKSRQAISKMRDTV